MKKKRKRALSKLRIIVEDNVAQVAWQREPSRELRFAPPVRVEYSEPENMQWYLEAYFQNPTPLAQKKANKVKKEMRYWGRKLFNLLFDNPNSRFGAILFQNAIANGMDKCEIVIVSDEQGALNTPWELMHSPEHDYLAPQLAGFYRTLNRHPIQPPLPCTVKNCLNILLIISRRERELESLRPYEFPRPLLETLKPFIARGQVMLKVLRPPTFIKMEQELNNNRGLFHIVHFDGHGVPGCLLFQRSFGGGDYVDGERIAQTLRNARVPIFLLSSCSAGVVAGHEPFPVGLLPPGVKPESSISDLAKESISSVATKMLALGASAVVGMLYDVLSDPLRRFMIRLYNELLGGSTIAAAVAAGRRSIITQPWRFNGEVNVLMEDWMVPVLYQQIDCAPIVRVFSRKYGTKRTSVTLKESELEHQMLIEVPKPGRIKFVGREFEMLELENLFQNNNVVVIKGLKGQGKTELACEWARWLVWTEGRKRVFFASFGEGCGLQRMVRIISLHCAKDIIEDSDFERQRKMVVRYLLKYPCLVIWDRFENVGEDSNKNNRRTKEREEISAFVRDLRPGKSWILITTRKCVRWLECEHRQLNLGGLDGTSAFQFALGILNEIGHSSYIDDDDFPKIVKSLGRNPLCMLDELPKLSKLSPKKLLRDIYYRLEKNNGTLYVDL